MRPNVVTIPHVTDYRRSEREDRPRARSARVRREIRRLDNRAVRAEGRVACREETP
jgi:hypothetical protein